VLRLLQLNRVNNCREFNLQHKFTMTVKQLEERLTKMESVVESIIARMEAVEKKIEPIEEWRKRVENAENKQAIHEVSVEDKMKEASSETDSKIMASELRSEEQIMNLGEKIKVTVDKFVEVERKVNEIRNEWPTPEEGRALMINKRTKEGTLNLSGIPTGKPSHAEKFKDKPKETIVILGDSLTRGVGAKLEYQSNMVTTICRPGAHIEDITDEVSRLGDNADRHIVLLVGTNEIKKEGSEIILEKYKNLIEESRKIKNRNVSVVGIPRRGDLNEFHNSRRIGVNSRLKKMCENSNIEFIVYEPLDSWLARDGLHLNHRGQNELSYIIYQHCGHFLV
jgi:lysophospholipase L1-like esterase